MCSLTVTDVEFKKTQNVRRIDYAMIFQEEKI